MHVALAIIVFFLTAWSDRMLVEGSRISVSSHVSDNASLFPFTERPGPKFHKSFAGALLVAIKGVETGRCGKVLEAHATIHQEEGQYSVATNFKENWAEYFGSKRSHGRLVAEPAGWQLHRLGALPIMRGHELLRVGDDPDVPKFERGKFLAHLRSISGPITFAFHVGLDLRACWGDMVDQLNRPVCGDKAFNQFSEDVQDLSATYVKSGQSGSTVVNNLDSFIIKSAKDADEYAMIQEVMPQLGDGILDRSKFPDGGCYRTALAPMCIVVVAPAEQEGYEMVHWIAMRKVEIPGADQLNITVRGTVSNTIAVDRLDLKGPKFAGVRDGKSSFSRDLWQGKDRGFTEMFPEGLHLHQCRSREAAYTLELDAELLMRHAMTDYSLLGVMYQPSDDECVCDATHPPRFPIILSAQYRKGRDVRQLRMAAGIIDYIEKTFKTGMMSSLSTMKESGQYKDWWMKMWPAYFKIPFHIPSPEFAVGDRIVALVNMKWRGINYDSVMIFMPDGKEIQVFHNQLLQSKSTIEGGSRYKAPTGSHGTIVATAPPIVLWDVVLHQDEPIVPMKKKVVFKVEPEQIAGLPGEPQGSPLLSPEQQSILISDLLHSTQRSTS